MGFLTIRIFSDSLTTSMVSAKNSIRFESGLRKKGTQSKGIGFSFNIISTRNRKKYHCKGIEFRRVLLLFFVSFINTFPTLVVFFLFIAGEVPLGSGVYFSCFSYFELKYEDKRVRKRVNWDLLFINRENGIGFLGTGIWKQKLILELVNTSILRVSSL